MKTPTKFQYPGFETIHWFAAKKLLKELKDLNIEDIKCPLFFLQGIKALLSILKIWNTDKDVSNLYSFSLFFFLHTGMKITSVFCSISFFDVPMTFFIYSKNLHISWIKITQVIHY